MGMPIHLTISHSVTEKEWKSVYREIRKLMKAFPLAEIRYKHIHGIKVLCMTPAKERIEVCGWEDVRLERGWRVHGDYILLCTAEEYYLPRDLVSREQINPNAGDAMLGAFPIPASYRREDMRFDSVYKLWGAPTYGEPYYIYLLAIACLIENRLGNKAFAYGDMTREDYEEATDAANRYLRRPIRVPARCDNMEKWYQRVSGCQLSESEKVTAFDKFYLGPKDMAYETYLKSVFSKEVLEEYRKKMISTDPISTIEFECALDKIKTKQKQEETYDINDFEELCIYKSGASIDPHIEKSLGNLYSFLQHMPDEDPYGLLKGEYDDLMKGTAHERCKWMIERNRAFLLRDKDWRRIFRNIKRRNSAFLRYYSLMHVQISNANVLEMVKALLANDALYARSKELSSIYVDDDRAEVV